jgi:hypothetical protein
MRHENFLRFSALNESLRNCEHCCGKIETPIVDQKQLLTSESLGFLPIERARAKRLHRKMALTFS